VVGPEPQGTGELDLPDREPPDAYAQLARALSRPGDQMLAIDTPSTPDLRRLSTKELRAERDRLQRELDGCPRDRRRELERASARHAEAEETLGRLTGRADRQRPAGGMLRRLGRGGPQPPADRGAVAVAGQLADRAEDTERQLRQHQQRRAGWLEGHAHLGPAYRQVLRELAWQRRARGLAQEVLEQDRPGYIRELLGPPPDSTRGRRAWRLAAGQVEQYRAAYDVADPERALGPEPREPAQRAAWRDVQTAVDRVYGKQRTQQQREWQPTRQQPTSRSAAAERGPTAPDPSPPQPTRPRRADRPGPERAAG
jgi:hypothetical protein